MLLYRPARVLLVASCVVLSAHAQEAPCWNVSPMPPSGSISAFGSNVVIQAARAVHYYSGVLRKWTVVPHSGKATVFDQYNDYAIVRDGNTVHGLCSRNPELIHTIKVSAAATVDPGPSARSWMAAVIDGSTVYGFSGFHGKWVPLRTKAPKPTVRIGGVTMVVNDGVMSYAMDAYHGTWIATKASRVLDVQSLVAIALDSSSRVHAYSPNKGAWKVISFPGASTATVRPGRSIEILTAGSVMLGFSSYTGSFSIYTASAAGIPVKTGPNLAMFVDGNRAVGFAAGTGGFSSVAGTRPSLEVATRIYGSMGLVTFADGRHYGFSAISGRFTKAPAGVFSSTPKAAAVLGQDSTKRPWAYSPILDRWVAGPRVAVASSAVMNESVVLVHAGGYEAFSSRTGEWVSQRLAGADKASVLTQGSMFTATLGRRVDIFDPRFGRWATVTTAGNPTVSIWRLVAMISDGRTGYGYSFFTGRIAPVALRGAVQRVKANSEIGYVLTDTHLHVFTAFGSFSTISTFPEFWRVQARGSDMRLIQIGDPGSSVLTIVGSATADLHVPPFGVVQIAPSSLLGIAPLGIVPASGMLDRSLPIPSDPALNGRILHLQNAVLPRFARPYLTSLVSPVIW